MSELEEQLAEKRRQAELETERLLREREAEQARRREQEWR